MATAVDSDPSLSQLEQHWKSLQKSYEAFNAQLKDFPHSFHLQNQEGLFNDQLKKVKGTLESALAVGYPTSLETARARNLLAYLHFRLGQPSEALIQIETVLSLEGQQHNLVSLANKAVILWRMEQRSQAQEQVQKLITMKAELSECSYLVVKAKAELAFSYTRFGPRFYPIAEMCFKEVIPQALEPELWLWKFGMALTRRRMLPSFVWEKSEHEEDLHTVLSSFLEIVSCCASDSLKARTYAEIACLLFSPRSDGLKESLQKKANMSAENACEMAVKSGGNENSVLWKCGKIYRYVRKTEHSRDLLQRAVSMRPTSKGHHQMGLTCIALAKQENLKAQGKFPLHNEEAASDNKDPISEETFKEFKAELSRSVSSESHGTLARMSSESESNTTLAEGSACTKEDKQCECTTPPAESSCNDKELSTEECYAMWKMVNSPWNVETQLEKGDPYVNEAIKHLQLAIELSEWENSAAVYELAVFLRSMGEIEQAKYHLERCLLKDHCLRITTKISAFEQLGLICADMARENPSKEESKRLTDQSQSMLLMALKTASESYSKQPAYNHHVREIWHSFPALLEAVDKNEKCSVRKLQDKAKLFKLIKENRKSLDILQDIEKMDPRKGNDPDHLKLCIENYVGMNKFEDALVFVEYLQCTAQCEQTVGLFEDEKFLRKLYLHAAKQSLQRGSPNFKSHFRAVFNDIVQSDTCTSSEDTDSEEAKTPAWDVHILHEETEEDTDVAAGLVSLLRDVCGLTVTRMDEDVMAGFYMEGVFGIMRRSKVLVVIAGTQKLSLQLRYLINMAARRPTSVSVVVKGGRVPRLMKPLRSTDLPSELPQITCGLDLGILSPQNVDAVCELVAFLADIQIAL
ncbi:uncharacterized protein LOC143288438 [Babylonia areolata]|uniref:uncharacterized protein LOC143288438 n=1 Tax=Babylonia areolata TaxID=304850 RepID=UPI003FD1CCEC